MVRTRAIMPAWAALFTVRYVVPMRSAKYVINLLTAGITAGVGDWRTEKGKGTFGQFRITNEDDAEFQSILKSGGMKAQLAAMDATALYDQAPADLFAWCKTKPPRPAS